MPNSKTKKTVTDRLKKKKKVTHFKVTKVFVFVTKLQRFLTKMQKSLKKKNATK